MKHPIQDIGLFTTQLQEDGSYLYKAKPPKLLTNVTKSKEVDKPQYPVLEELIVEMKKTVSIMISNIEKELLVELKKIL